MSNISAYYPQSRGTVTINVYKIFGVSSDKAKHFQCILTNFIKDKKKTTDYQ